MEEEPPPPADSADEPPPKAEAVLMGEDGKHVTVHFQIQAFRPEPVVKDFSDGFAICVRTSHTQNKRNSASYAKPTCSRLYHPRS